MSSSLSALFWAICLIICSQVDSIPVDNGVEGDPEVECLAGSININFNARNPFEGHVFVKGLFDTEGCRTDGTGERVANIELPFDSCNVQRSRSLNPLGVFVSATVIITFHPNFITKVDRAYRIQCFYMEADKTVSTDIEVSMLTTGFQTQVVPMPVCRYEILDGPTGDVVQYALVGEAVYHRWTCDTETTDTFCMTVHSCFVDDGAGDSADLLDSEGCAIDRYLLRNLEYLSDLQAGQETHVFKYADRPQLFFNCQITITIKEPNGECPVPACSEPAGPAAGASAAVGSRASARVAAANVIESEIPTRPRPRPTTRRPTTQLTTSTRRTTRRPLPTQPRTPRATQPTTRRPLPTQPRFPSTTAASTLPPAAIINPESAGGEIKFEPVLAFGNPVVHPFEKALGDDNVVVESAGGSQIIVDQTVLDALTNNDGDDDEQASGLGPDLLSDANLRLRVRRSFSQYESAGTVDVSAYVDALDLDAPTGGSHAHLPMLPVRNSQSATFKSSEMSSRDDAVDAYCLNEAGLGAVMLVLIGSTITTILTNIVLYRRK